MKRQARDSWIGAVVQVVLLFFGLLATLSLFFGQSGFPNIGYILLSGVFFALLFSLVFLIFKGRTRTFLLLGIFGVWLLIGLFSFDYLAFGAQTASGYITPYLSQITHLEFAAVPGGQAGIKACADFCVYCVFPYTGFLTWVVVFRKSALLSLLGTVPLFAFSYGNLSRPSGVSLAFLFVFWIAIILQSRVLRINKDVKPGFSLLCLALAAGVFCTIFAAAPQETYHASKNAINLRLDLTNAAMDFGYSIRGLRGFPSGMPLSSSDGTIRLDTTGSVQFADREVLRVHSDNPYTMYLRGYSASVYTGHEWLQPDKQDFAESGVSIEPLQYLGTENLLSPDSITTTVTVEPDRTDSKFLFTPYLLVDIASADPAPSWHGDAYLASDGQASYTFEAYTSHGNGIITAGSASNLWQLKAELPQNTGSMELEGYTFRYEIFSAGGVLYYPEGSGIPPAVMEEAEALLTDVFFMGGTDKDGLLQTEETPDAGYLSYIQNEYTQLPDGLRETLLAWWSSLHGEDGQVPLQLFYESPGEISPPYWEIAAELVASEISQSGSYTTNPGPQPTNRDFVEYFLTEGKQGYCIHYASATTAMLRAIGIPARYVEGYVVGKDSFGSDGWASVSADQAHSWAEIWLPGIGWIPVDSTPGGTAASEAVAMPSFPASAASSSAAPIPSPAETPSPSADFPEDVQPGPQQTAKSGSYAGPAVFLTIIVALACVPLVRRCLARKKRARLMDDPDPNHAALGIYTYLDELRAFGGEIPQGVKDIALKAKFSRHPVSSEELAFLRGKQEAERARVTACLPRGKKFPFWLSGL